MTLLDIFALKYERTVSRGLVTVDVEVGWFWVAVGIGILLTCIARVW